MEEDGEYNEVFKWRYEDVPSEGEILSDISQTNDCIQR
jgi:hypothetical protein